VLLGVWLEVAFAAPIWVQLLVTGPFMLATCIPPLRPLKGWLVASQYFYKAEEGRMVTPLIPPASAVGAGSAATLPGDDRR